MARDRPDPLGLAAGRPRSHRPMHERERERWTRKQTDGERRTTVAIATPFNYTYRAIGGWPASRANVAKGAVRAAVTRRRGGRAESGARARARGGGRIGDYAETKRNANPGERARQAVDNREAVQASETEKERVSGRSVSPTTTSPLCHQYSTTASPPHLTRYFYLIVTATAINFDERVLTVRHHCYTTVTPL